MTGKKVALVAAQVLLAVLVGLGIRELWLASRGNDGAGGQAPETLAVRAGIAPDVHAFGEPILATVDVVADAGFIKPETVRIEADFAPYELDGEPTVERNVADGVAHVVFRYPLRCLREGCDASGARGVAQFEPGLVRFRYVDGSGPGRYLLEWPPVEVASRVSGADLEGLRWRADETTLPDATMRVGPVGLAAVLIALALLLVGAALWLARGLWRSASEEAVDESRETRTPLERALDLVLADSLNGSSSDDRRQTLERLARELTAAGEEGLAEDARELAWSSRAASGDEVLGFARRVTEATGVGAA
jgi:hypothetical protein